MKPTRGRETATKPRAWGASGTPGASAHRPGPAGSHERRCRSRVILFFLFLFFFFFFPSIPNQPIWGVGGCYIFVGFFFFLNIWKFLHPIQSEKKEKKKALTRQNPRNPSSILAALLGGDPCAQEGLYEQPRARSAHVPGPRTLGHSAGTLPRSQVRGCGMLPCIPPMGLCRRNAKP